MRWQFKKMDLGTKLALSFGVPLSMIVAITVGAALVADTDRDRRKQER